MNDFPDFMKNSANRIASGSQSKGVRGWVYDGIEGSQMAYWICECDGLSDEHVRDFDEYFAVIQGVYTLIIRGKKIPLGEGEEYHIKKIFLIPASLLQVPGQYIVSAGKEQSVYSKRKDLE
jgi:hypothetical protein